jgi:RHS repeat-associated protein
MPQLGTQETSTLGPTQNYGYDAAGQLTSDSAGPYSYDLSGNRTMTGYQTGTANQLATDGNWNFTYDDAGNMTKKVATSGGETWNYFYDNVNRLVRVERHSSDGGPLTQLDTFKYDALGERIQKSFDDDGDDQDAVITRFAYDRGNAWADLDVSGNLITRRLYEDAIDKVFARISSGGSVDWYLTDRLGSIRDLTDGTGALRDHLDYTSYGKLTTESNPGYADRYTWTGRERDTEINLQYNRARYYDWSTGRWLSQDPLGFDAGDSNLYRYVNNQPTNATDSSGTEAIIQRGRDVAHFVADLERAGLQVNNWRLPSGNEFLDIRTGNTEETLKAALVKLESMPGWKDQNEARLLLAAAFDFNKHVMFTNSGPVTGVKLSKRDEEDIAIFWAGVLHGQPHKIARYQTDAILKFTLWVTDNPIGRGDKPNTLTTYVPVYGAVREAAYNSKQGDRGSVWLYSVKAGVEAVPVGAALSKGGRVVWNGVKWALSARRVVSEATGPQPGGFLSGAPQYGNYGAQSGQLPVPTGRLPGMPPAVGSDGAMTPAFRSMRRPGPPPFMD